MFAPRFALSLLSLGLFALPACDDDDDGAESETGDQARVCETEDRNDEYAVGLEKSGTTVKIALMDATPAPPDRGDNAWVIRVTDQTGAPMSDTTISVTPFMPDHGHGTGVQAEVTPMDGDGEFTVNPVNLFMAGLWEVTFEVTMADETTDEVKFAFCVEP